jgi:predicted nucleic acid-binding protein
MGVLVDTNVLLRRTQPDHPSFAVAVESVARLLAAGETVHYAFQTISEFRNVMTRPAINNGLGFDVATAFAEVEKIERVLTLLPDLPAVYGQWRHLIVAHAVLGAKVPDAKLVALMQVHGVERILTFNVGDFGRYPVQAVHPSAPLV